MTIRIAAGVLLLALLALQYRLWVSGSGLREVWRLEQAIAAQQRENDGLESRNRALAAEVRDLKEGQAALEERARTDLGMVGANETFYQLVPPAAGSTTDATSTAKQRTAQASRQ
ncbi:MAG TPA: cell division protein FtsB [Burkholderiales bacterium]|nr:cell division protein FtsB [Burkholderiales bacterium]